MAEFFKRSSGSAVANTSPTIYACPAGRSAIILSLFVYLSAVPGDGVSAIVQFNNGNLIWKGVIANPVGAICAPANLAGFGKIVVNAEEFITALYNNSLVTIHWDVSVLELS